MISFFFLLKSYTYVYKKSLREFMYYSIREKSIWDSHYDICTMLEYFCYTLVDKLLLVKLLFFYAQCTKRFAWMVSFDSTLFVLRKYFKR